MNQCAVRKISDLESLQIDLIKAWLFKINEPAEDQHIVIDKCKRDLEAREYFIRHAHGEFE